MIALMRGENILDSTEAKCIVFDQEKQLLAFRRGAFLFAFNFHPDIYQPSVLLSASAGSYALVLHSEAADFGGSMEHTEKNFTSDGRGIGIDLPPLSAVVIKKL